MIGAIRRLPGVDSPGTVGYGARHTICLPGIIAFVVAGASNLGCPQGGIGAGHASIVGRISMDLMTFEGLPSGRRVHAIGPRRSRAAVLL
ncbi:MAG: hypothetical protein P4M00_25990 [Azospirillaceae bacterium]|nr:hypothetical protein [Azospirillaceae bacterium]